MALDLAELGKLKVLEGVDLAHIRGLLERCRIATRPVCIEKSAQTKGVGIGHLTYGCQGRFGPHRDERLRQPEAR